MKLLTKLKNIYKFPIKKPNIELKSITNQIGYSVRTNLLEFITEESVKLVFEIGCNQGYITRYILENNSSINLICFDDWLGTFEQHMSKSSFKNIFSLYSKFIINTWSHKKRVTPIRARIETGLHFYTDIFAGKSEDIPDLIFYHPNCVERDSLKLLMRYCLFEYPNSIHMGYGYNTEYRFRDFLNEVLFEDTNDSILDNISLNPINFDDSDFWYLG